MVEGPGRTKQGHVAGLHFTGLRWHVMTQKLLQAGAGGVSQGQGFVLPG